MTTSFLAGAASVVAVVEAAAGEAALGAAVAAERAAVAALGAAETGALAGADEAEVSEEAEEEEAPLDAATGEAVEDTRPRVRTAGLGAPSAALGAAARIALGGLSPGMGFSTGILTESFLAEPEVDETPETSSSRIPSHLRAGFAQERSWEMLLATICLNRGVLKTCGFGE